MTAGRPPEMEDPKEFSINISGRQHAYVLAFAQHLSAISGKSQSRSAAIRRIIDEHMAFSSTTQDTSSDTAIEGS